MKKKITLMIILIVTSSLSLLSQILSNTTWSVYNASNSLYLYFHFGTDTLSYSMDNISFTNLSTFQESGNNFTLIDLPDGPCPSDTGRYTFLIQNDTLKFNLISDLCDTRPEVFTEYHWINLTTGIQVKNLLPSVKICPNPANDVISIRSNIDIQNATYLILDQLGKKLLTGKLNGKITMIDIGQLSRGLYFFHIGTKSNQTIKFMKK